MSRDDTEVYGPQPIGEGDDKVSNLLEQAEFAGSDTEAEKLYDQVLDIEPTCELAWYKKWLLKLQHVKTFYNERKPPFLGLHYRYGMSFQEKEFSSAKEQLEYFFGNRQAVCRELDRELAKRRQRHEKEYLNKIRNEFEDLKDSLQRVCDTLRCFKNAVKAAPDNYNICEKCEGAGSYKVKQSRFLLPDKQVEELCDKCVGLGKVREKAIS